jgi:hypothetical protein
VRSSRSAGTGSGHFVMMAKISLSIERSEKTTRSEIMKWDNSKLIGKK